jgi:uncharacterized repeat protein (TIGR01451 family)
MFALRRSMTLVFVLLIALMPGLAAWPPAPEQATALAATPRVAYVYNTDTASRDSFKTLLELRGFVVDLVALADVATTDFSVDQAIIIGDDTGNLSTWGTPTDVAVISRSSKPVVGVGEGGYAFFGKQGLAIGWGNGAHGSENQITVVDPTQPIFSTPNPISLPPAGPLKLYNSALNTVEIYLPGIAAADVMVIGRTPADAQYAPLIAQRSQAQCNTLWGYSGAPAKMTPTGQDLFENIVRGNPCAARVAYVYNTDTTSRDSFQSLLVSRGLAVDLVTVTGAETFDFSNDQAIIIGNDTGDLDVWGTPAAVSHVNAAGKPIVGVGEGGYAFFGRLLLAIGWGNGWHGPSTGATVVDGAQAIYAAPYPVAVSTGATLTLTSVTINTVEINVVGAAPAGVSLIGRSLSDQQHYALISQRGAKNECYALWGSSGAPAVMTTIGQDLFVNMVLGKPCGEAPSASADLSISKTGAPDPATAGANLTYKLTVANAGPSTATAVKVTDTLPAGVSLISVTPSQGTCSFGATVICQLGSLTAGGAVASVTLVVKPNAAGKLVNSASVSSAVSDPNGANNTASLNTNVDPAPVIPPVLALPYTQFINIPIQAFLQNDLTIAGIEITQGVQCFDTSKGLASCANNSLPVIAKKDTTARIYLKCTNLILASCSKSNVPVRLHIFANGVEYIANALGKATPGINQATHDGAEIYFNVNFSSDVPVSFYAEVDPNNAISESNETNNRSPASGTFTLNFRNRTTMNIVGQRLRYHPSGYAGAQYAGGAAVNGVAASWFSQVLPIRNNGISYSVASGYKDWTTSLGGADGQHALIQSLNTQWILQNAFSWLFGTGSFTGARHVYGWAPSAGYSGGHADMPVYPHAGGLGIVGIGSDAAGADTDNPGSGALIFGHELTHDHNILHTNTADSCGSSDGNADFPYSSSSIQEFGFNPITGKIYDPANTHDLMSYCPSGGSKQGWISPFTWNKMFNNLSASALATAAAPAASYSSTLVINATIGNPALGPETGHFGDLHKVDTDAPLTAVPAGAYSVELRNGATKLISQTFNVSFESEYGAGNPLLRFNTAGAGTPTPQANVSFVMPWAEGTTSIVLLHGATVLESRTVSAGAPSVLITSPSAPVSWMAGTTQTLTWAGADPDGDALRYSVFYSNDGSDWGLLESGITGSSFDLNVDALAGGANARFRVVATDGVNVGFDETNAPISVPDKLPIAAITDPGAAGNVVAPGDLLLATGMGFDLEDGTLPDEALAWSSDRQGVLGSGPSLAVNTLQPGLHTITLTVHDSAGQAATATAQVFVGTRVALPIARR